jgi:hypothetical protein
MQRQSSLTLNFGPQPPQAGARLWVKTIPDKRWFAFLRLYAPQAHAADGGWRPGDFAQRPITL